MPVLVAGHFNILHPGHIRLFKFARTLESKLIVAVESDRIAGPAAHISEDLRLEGVRNCTLVDEAFVSDEPVTALIERLRPSVVVKGKEFESKFNAEAELLKSYGGRLIFSSGEMQFSSVDLIRYEFTAQSEHTISLPQDFMERHGITTEGLSKLIDSFSRVNVLTIGDMIIDDYINCEPLGMSQEDPTLVVTPVAKNRFVGGAGIVAAHVQGLGAKSRLISVVGEDSAGEFCLTELESLGVNCCLVQDVSRPTTIKERFRSHGKTLLRVSHLQQGTVAVDLQTAMIQKAMIALKECNVLMFSDFNYGVLPQAVVEKLIEMALKNEVMIIADSQSSSQLGDVSRFKDVDLLLPTEREARVSTQNREDGLVVLAEELRQKSNAKNIFLKLGADGVLIHAPDYSFGGWLTDQVGALNYLPKDVAGAGDSMMVGSALALGAGANIWEAACIGSIAASIQVSRVGNLPLSTNLIQQVLNR